MARVTLSQPKIRRKITPQIFQETNKKQNDMDMVGKMNREMKILLMATPNSSIKTKNIKSKIDRIWQSSKYRLYNVKDETVSHVIGECRKMDEKI